MSKKDLPLFKVRNHESFGIFSILSRKSVFGSGLRRVCVERSGTSADAMYAGFSCFCYVGIFGNFRGHSKGHK